MSGFAHRKEPPDARIIRQRVAEEKTNVLREHVKATTIVGQYAAWENKTDAAIQRNVVQGRFNKLQEEQDAALEARRRRLAELLAAEEQGYQMELASSRTTPEERRANLEQRALALYEKREAERVALAQEALYRQWREGCDDVRTTDSQATTLQFAQLRKQQMVDKLGRKMTEAEEARFWHQLNEEERVKKEERHLRDVEQARQRSVDAIAQRDMQLEQLAERRRIEAEEAARDLSDLKAKWEAADAKAAADERAAAARAAQIAADVKVFNAQKRAQLDAEREAERLLDLQLVHEAIRRNQEEEEKERLIREAKRQGDEEYRKHLAFLALKSQEETGERDRLIAEYNEREFQKRDEVRQREEAARQALLQDVMANNKQQLEDKARARLAAEEERVRERERYELDKRAMGEAAARAAAAQRAAVYLRKAELEAQVRAKEERKAAERAASQAEVEQQRFVEAQYKQMLEQEKLAAKPPQDFRRKKNNWYD